jgi:hypothetical protein
MVNFIELLVGLAAVCLIGAVVLAVRRRGPLARRYTIASVAALILAIGLELFLRWQ